MSISVLLPGPDAPPPTIEIAHSPPPPDDGAVERRWAELTHINPRLFDGPILSVDSIDLAAGLIRCRREGYKRLAVQPQVPTGVDLLSVTGILTARDRAGGEHILLGQRSPQTRIYGGLWELAPSGGIDPPAPGLSSIPWPGILRQLEAELSGETGLRDPFTGARLFCIVRDARAASTDLAVRASLPSTIERLDVGRGNWEYIAARWLPLADIAAFAAREPMVNATRAILSRLGWL